MKMQDNEFDELFRSRLNDFEVGPSHDVWKTISLELNAGSRRKTLMPILSIAATILVLIAAGILFIPQKTNLKTNKHPVNNSMVKVPRIFNTQQVVRNHPNKNILNSDKVNKPSIFANRI